MIENKKTKFYRFSNEFEFWREIFCLSNSNSMISNDVFKSIDHFTNELDSLIGKKKWIEALYIIDQLKLEHFLNNAIDQQSINKRLQLIENNILESNDPLFELENQRVAVKIMKKEKGRCVYSTEKTNFEIGQTIFEDQPLVFGVSRAMCTQYCSFCLRVLLDPNEILEECQFNNGGSGGVGENGNLENLLKKHKELFPLFSVVSCKLGCVDDVYCSLACRDSHWNSNHRFLCEKNKAENIDRELLKLFRQLRAEPKEYSKIDFQMLLNVLIQTFVDFNDQTTLIEEEKSIWNCWMRFGNFQWKWQEDEWFDPNLSNANFSELVELLKSLFSLLHEKLGYKMERKSIFEQLITEKRMKSFLSIIRLNCVEISPFTAFDVWEERLIKVR